MSIFREYDVRGIVGKDLTFDVAQSIGRAYGTMARQRGSQTVALGRDGRLTSLALRDRVLAGITSTGVNVVDIGVCPTPLLYFALYELPVDGGVMVTGSHNPAEYNGFKMCIEKMGLYGEDIQELRRLIETGASASGSGTVSTAQCSRLTWVISSSTSLASMERACTSCLIAAMARQAWSPRRPWSSWAVA